MKRIARRWWWLGAFAAVVGVPVAWYLASPLFLNRVVTEQFTPAATTVIQGRFQDADGFHKGSGLARVVATSSGAEVRFEEFAVTNGPDLYVYLAVHPQPRARREVDEGFINLGRLKGNVGPQAYGVPAETDLARYRSVVIYCRAFHVVFSTATFAPPP